MRIDFAKLKAAGFRVQEETGGISIYSNNPVSAEFVDMLREHVKDPMLQDLFVGTTLATLETVQILDALR